MNISLQNAANNPAPESSYFPVQQEAGLHYGASAYLPSFRYDKDIRNYWAINTSQPVNEWESIVASNLANDARFFPQQEETSLCHGTFAYLPNFPCDQRVLNYGTTGICQPAQECGRSVVEPVTENSYSNDYLGATTCPLNIRTEIHNFDYLGLAPQSLSGEYRTEFDASSLNAFYVNDKGLSESIQTNEKRILYNTNIPTKMGNYEHLDFWLRHRVEDQQTFSGKAQNQILSEIAFQDCDAGRTEPQNTSEIPISFTNAESIGRSSCGQPFLQKKIGTFICKECGKSFGSRYKLVVHYRTHTGEKPFTCNVCGRAFSQKCNLKNHIRIHTGEKPFACKDCGQSFSHETNLKNHIWIHTGEKPFFCKDCGQSFSHKTNLKNHNRIHTKQKLCL